MQTPSAMAEDDAGAVAKAAGFSLHAGVAGAADERRQLESQGQGVVLFGAPRMQNCGGTVKIIASIEDRAVIKTILALLEKTSRTPATRTSPPAARAPPQASHPSPTDQVLLLTVPARMPSRS